MSYNLLKGKKGIIFGALNPQSIAWKVAENVVKEGAKIILTNTPVAIRMGEIKKLAEQCRAKLIPADATKLEDMENLTNDAVKYFNGKFDFILHAIAMSPNVRKGKVYNEIDYNYLIKTLDISAISFHKILHFCYKKDAINRWGSIVSISYVASQNTMYAYNDMADAKAMLESIVRSFGYIYGRERKVRINSISQSPTLTTAGSGVKGIENLLDFSERMSPLGNADAQDCANFCAVLFSDLTRKITMQNIFHDGGFSSMGMSIRAMDQYSKSFDK